MVEHNLRVIESQQDFMLKFGIGIELVTCKRQLHQSIEKSWNNIMLL